VPPIALQLNVPVELDRDLLEVAPGLPPGEHRIKLEVIDDRQIRSKPTFATVTIVREP
jgi:hypothetical protein